MSLKLWRKKIKAKSISESIGVHIQTVHYYFQGKLKWTATEKKIASYLNKVHNEEIKWIIK